MKQIILASQSPRRKELLAQAGFEFQIITSDVEEKITREKPEEIAEVLSCQKAEDVFNKILYKHGSNRIRDYLVIGADTIVSIDGKILGKPKDRQAAYDMIKTLQGRTHYVYTGVTFVTMGDTGKEVRSFSEGTRVTFYPITDEEISEYINSGNEWADKAGAYAVQGTVGAKFVKSIEGDYNNVVGLPVARLYQELKNIEPDIATENEGL